MNQYLNRKAILTTHVSQPGFWDRPMGRSLLFSLRTPWVFYLISMVGVTLVASLTAQLFI